MGPVRLLVPAFRLVPALLLAASLAACAGTPATAPVPAPAVVPPAAGAGPAAAPAPGPRLSGGERLFVAARPGAAPWAERHRRIELADGTFREEVAAAPAFSRLEGAAPAQVFGVSRDARGLAVRLLDAGGRAEGEGRLEIAAPLAPGTTWEVDLGNGRRVRGAVEAREDVEVPGGPVAGALRVTHRSLTGPARTMTTWYDESLWPVRAEVRGEDGELLEARAVVRGDPPGPEACAAAMEWARSHLLREDRPAKPATERKRPAR